MNKDVYISDIEVITMPIELKNRFQIKIKLFDINYSEDTFLTSLMKEQDAFNYKKNLFKLFNASNLFQVLYNPQIKTLATVKDDTNKIIGLEINNSLILKNEIKLL